MSPDGTYNIIMIHDHKDIGPSRFEVYYTTNSASYGSGLTGGVSYNRNPLAVDGSGNGHVVYYSGTTHYGLINASGWNDYNLGSLSHASIAANGSEAAISYVDGSGNIQLIKNTGASSPAFDGAQYAISHGEYPATTLGSADVYFTNASGFYLASTQNVTPLANTSVQLLVNGQEGNVTVAANTAVGESVQVLSGLNNYMIVYADGNYLWNGSGPQGFGNNWTSEGMHTYQAVYPETETESSSSEISYITVIDNDTPVVTQISPSDLAATNNSAEPLYYNVTDVTSGIANCTLYLNSAPFATVNLPAEGVTLNFTPTLSEGPNSWQVHCTDDSSMKNVGSSAARTIILDTTSPTVTLIGTATYNNASTINITYTAVDAYSPNETCGLYIDGSLNQTMDGVPNNATRGFVVAFAQGNHSRQVSCTDWTGNVGTSALDNFLVDWTAPNMGVISPTNGYASNSSNLSFVFNATDNFPLLLGNDQLMSCWLYVNGSMAASNSSVKSSAITTLSATLPEAMNYPWHITCKDNSNNYDSTADRNVSVDLHAPATALSLNGTIGQSGWYTTIPTITLTCSDSGAGCNITYYNLSSAGNYAQYPGPVNGIYGINSLHYYSTDNAGNVESVQTQSIKVDNVAPSCTYWNTTFGSVNESKNLSVYANVTEDYAGIAILYVNGASAQNISGSNNPLFVWSAPGSLAGQDVNFSIQFFDQAGNMCQTGNFSAHVNDTTPPVVSLVSPSNATITNNATKLLAFNVTDNTNYVANCSLFIDGIVNHSWTGGYSTPSSINRSITFNDGWHNWSAECHDSAGNLGSSGPNTIFVDATAPEVISSNTSAPTVNTTQNLVIWANWTEANPATALLYVNGANVQNLTGQTYTNFTWTAPAGLAETFVNFTITLIDTAGNNATTPVMQAYVRDTIPPAVSLVSPANGAAMNNASVQFVFYPTDNIDPLANCSLYLDSALNYTATNVINGTNFNVPTMGLFESYHSWYVKCFDHSGNMATSATWGFNVDQHTPWYTGIAASPTSPASYAPGAIYQFNVTWHDDQTAVNSVWIEFNGTNYSSVSHSGATYMFNMTGLGAGTYAYRWFANDSAGNLNNSMPPQSYTINPATATCSLVMTPGGSATYPNTATPNCTCTNPEMPTQILLVNGSAGTGYASVTDITGMNHVASVFAGGNYTFNCTANATQNYTSAANATAYAIVPAAPALNITYAPSNPLGYPTSSTANGTGCPAQINCTLYRNGTQVSNPDTQTLGAGLYTYVYNTSGGQNYSAATIMSVLNVTPAVPVLTLSANPGWLAMYNQSTNVTCVSSNPSQVVPMLYLNGTLKNPAGDFETLGAGVWFPSPSPPACTR